MERQSDETVVRQSGRFPISYGKPVQNVRRQPAVDVERQSDETVVRQSGRFPISYGKPVQNVKQQPTAYAWWQSAIYIRQQSEI